MNFHTWEHTSRRSRGVITVVAVGGRWGGQADAAELDVVESSDVVVDVLILLKARVLWRVDVVLDVFFYPFYLQCKVHLLRLEKDWSLTFGFWYT